MNSPRSRPRNLLMFAVLIASLMATYQISVVAQTDQGRISGTVSDSNGGLGVFVKCCVRGTSGGDSLSLLL
jgi:hypothetical protein